MLLKEAILAALALFICYGGNWLLGQCMIERPIVVGAVTGLLLGDVTTGVMMGAALEAIFMGVVNIGGAIAAEPVSATVFATTFAIVLKIDTDAALALAVPIGVVSAAIAIGMGVMFNVFAPVLDRLCAKGDDKGITWLQFIMWFISYFVKALIVFFGVLWGSAPLEAAINNIPAVVMTGLSTCGGLLSAVGMAILMRMLWSKNLAVFYFAGFICVAYLNIPLVAVAVIGVIIAVTGALRDKEIFDLVKTKTAVAAQNVSEEEAFFE